MPRFSRRNIPVDTIESLTAPKKPENFKLNIGDIVIWKCPAHSKERMWKITSYIERGESDYYKSRSIACMGDTSSCGPTASMEHHTMNIPIGEAVLYTGDECDMIEEIIDDFAWTADKTPFDVSGFIMSHVLPNIRDSELFSYELNVAGDSFSIATKCSRMKGKTFSINKQ
tara:strand:+ start:10 stop:522 length:513 start_codon:yes stop_codon:yes gene_type:complete